MHVNTIIRKLFDDYSSPNIRRSSVIHYFSDKYRSGNSRRVFKVFYATPTVKAVWVKVLKQLREIGISGWELYEGNSFFCHSSNYVVGIKKYVKDD